MTNETKFVTSVAFVGMPNVGKSTLLNAVIGTKIAPTTRKPQTTRRVVRGIKTVGNYQHIYFDTPGALKNVSGIDTFMHKQIFQAIKEVDQIVAIVDAKEPLKRAQSFLEKIIKIAREEKLRFILAINKIDELKNKEILFALIKQYADALDIYEIVPISALKNDGLEELFLTLNKGAKEGNFIFSEELFTDASEKDIVAELIREKAMLELKDEIPYKITATIENFDESRRDDQPKPLVEIEAALHVERDSQKAIVIGKRGDTIKSIGTRARKDIEFLLGCQVMLKLFVRVEPNWTTNPKSLRKLGY